MGYSLNIEELKENLDDIYVVHCSFGKTTNENHVMPRVLSIYVKNLDSSSSSRFSIERYASKQSIELIDLANWYDDLEIAVLDEFNSFLREKSDCTFFFWAEPGHELIFDLIESRFEEINPDDSNKIFNEIPVAQRSNVQNIVNIISGEIDTELELKQFIKLHNNGQKLKNSLTSWEEGVRFEKNEFDVINSSITAKVDFFIGVLRKCIGSYSISSESDVPTFRTADLDRLSLIQIISIMKPGAIMTLIGAGVALFLAGIGINNYFVQQEIKTLNKENSVIQKEFKARERVLSDSLKTYKTILDDYELMFKKDSMSTVDKNRNSQKKEK